VGVVGAEAPVVAENRRPPFLSERRGWPNDRQTKIPAIPGDPAIRALATSRSADRLAHLAPSLVEERSGRLAEIIYELRKQGKL
jgi:hypothetical protein